MRLSSCVPRRVPPARAVGAVCAVPLLRGRTSFSLPALLRAVERIFACPVRFRGRAARPGNRMYTAGTATGLYTADPGSAGHTQCLGCPLTGQSRVAQPALVTLDSLFAFARPAPLRVACLSFGFVDADLPDSRCRRCRQSVEPANTSLLTARRLRPAGLRPASRRLSRRSSAPERTITFFPAPKEREERRSFRCRSPAQPSTAGRPSARPFPSSAAEPCRLGPRDSPPFFCDVTAPLG